MLASWQSAREQGEVMARGGGFVLIVFVLSRRNFGHLWWSLIEFRSFDLIRIRKRDRWR